MARRWTTTLVLLLALGGAGTAGADQIKMKDGAEVTGSVLQKDGQSVILRLPREAVATVNGKPLPPPVTDGAMAPEFKATDLFGATHTLADNRGHVTLLQFWASWCPHCRADVPMVKDVVARYHDQGLKLLTVSIDQDLNALKSFIEKEQLAFPIITALAHPDLPDLYETQSIPAYFLIDATGKIAKTWRGSLSEGQATGKSELDGLLTTLLKTPEAPAKPTKKKT